MKAASKKTGTIGVLALCAAVASAIVTPEVAFAQDRVVGREALDPKDQEKLPPAVDGRTDADEDVDPRALEEFREPLAPHGTWVDDPHYGTIWVPHAREVGADFTPYQTAGHWELTSDGDWLWVSDYAWGDIPFHYGRWVWVGGYGWGWVPGRVWAPAWVVWRTGPYGYVGWGPCPPTWGWYGGSAVWLWWPPPAPYWFVETRYVFARNVHTRVIREPARVGNAARQTTPQRRPANPSGRGGLDAHRPARPELDKMRYDGVRPAARAPERHPEIGLDRSRGGTTASGLSARGTRPDAGLSRSRGTKGLDRSPGNGAGITRGDGRGVTPSGRPDRPALQNDSTRGVQPKGPPRRGEPERAAPDREARPAPRGPSNDAPSRDPGRGISPSRDASPSRDVGPAAPPSRASSPGPSSPSRPATSTPTRKPSVAPSAPASKGRSSGPSRSRGRR